MRGYPCILGPMIEGLSLGDKKMAFERRWLTARETSEYLNLNPKSVYRACSEKKIPYSKIPGVGVRVDKKALDALLERRGHGPEEFGDILKGNK
jgi:excisionase family DNA binding protein